MITTFFLATNYPGLSAIIQHHLVPMSTYYNTQPSITTASPQRTRFDVSTTTFDHYDQQQQRHDSFARDSSPSFPPFIYRHDGYIRPLTPPKSSIPPDGNIVRVDPDDLRGWSPSSSPGISYHNLSEPPVMYRSSTTIYTRDKQSNLERGEMRTWTIPGTDDTAINTKSSTYSDHEINIPKVTSQYQYNLKPYKQETSASDDEEEKYLVSYEYERNRLQQHPYNSQQYSNHQYSRKMNNK